MPLVLPYAIGIFCPDFACLRAAGRDPLEPVEPEENQRQVSA